MTGPGTVAPRAIDALGKRAFIDGQGKRLVMAGGYRRIGVVAKHAIVGDGAAEVVVVRTVVARIHGPVAALFGIPAQRQLDQRVGRSPVEIGSRVISGTHDVVDALLHHVDLAAGGIQLIAPLIIFAAAPEHGEITVRRTMEIRVVAGKILNHNLRRRAIKGTAHAGFLVALPHVAVAGRARIPALRVSDAGKICGSESSHEDPGPPRMPPDCHAWASYYQTERRACEVNS